jgi:hypothetical protein
MFRTVLIAALSLWIAAAAAQTPEDRAAIRSVIERQLDAFAHDDGEAAFGFASPAIRGMFGSAEIFMAMVREGYRPVYRPRSVSFNQLVEANGALVQLVDLVGPDGVPVTAAYEMLLLPDGTWRINGCTLLRGPAA